MSWLTDYFRRRRVDRVHLTRRFFARQIAKHGFEIGDYTYGEPVVRFSRWEGAKLKIGNYCSIASDVEIILGLNHRSDWISTYPFKAGQDRTTSGAARELSSKGDVVIGSDVWIGTGATILSGVTIGHGAIIGARAVVSRDVAPYAVVVGNPAQSVRQRFSDDVIAALLQIQWWNLDRTEVTQLVPLLQSDDPHPFIAECRRQGLIQAEGNTAPVPQSQRARTANDNA
jgi:acetyltransferase-like isoleucine patch superfamily enzyme